MLHVNLITLLVDINKLHVNLIILYDNKLYYINYKLYIIIKLACSCKYMLAHYAAVYCNTCLVHKASHTSMNQGRCGSIKIRARSKAKMQAINCQAGRRTIEKQRKIN